MVLAAQQLRTLFVNTSNKFPRASVQKKCFKNYQYLPPLPWKTLWNRPPNKPPLKYQFMFLYNPTNSQNFKALRGVCSGIRSGTTQWEIWRIFKTGCWDLRWGESDVHNYSYSWFHLLPISQGSVLNKFTTEEVVTTGCSLPLCLFHSQWKAVLASLCFQDSHQQQKCTFPRFHVYIPLYQEHFLPCLLSEYILHVYSPRSKCFWTTMWVKCAVVQCLDLGLQQLFGWGCHWVCFLHIQQWCPSNNCH